MPVHPARDQAVEPLEPRLGGAQVGPGERAHDLDRDGGDVVVRGHRRARDGRAGDAPAAQVDALDGGGAADLDAEALEVRDPRVDPDVRGRPVEHAVRPPARAGEVEQQLQQDRAAGARAHLARPRRHERAREAVGEELLERRRALLRAHVGPPALELPLAEAALVAAGEQRQQALEEPRRLLRRDAEARRGCEHEAGDEREVLQRLRQVCGREQLVAAVALGEQHAVGPDEVAVDADAAASCPGRGGRSRGRSGTRARPAGRRGRRSPEPGTGRLRALPPRRSRAS